LEDHSDVSTMQGLAILPNENTCTDQFTLIIRHLLNFADSEYHGEPSAQQNTASMPLDSTHWTAHNSDAH